MQTMPNQVVDQHGAAAHSRRFSNKGGQLLRVQVMGEKAAAHQVERSIGERQDKRIGHDPGALRDVISACAISGGEMRRGTVKQRYIQVDSAP